MKKSLFFSIFFFTAISFVSRAQTINPTHIKQYQELITWTQQDFNTCRQRLEQWGFTYNKGNTINMFTMIINPFVRMDENDTTGVMLATINDVVYSVGGLYSSLSPSRCFALIAQAGDLQQQIAEEKVLTKYTCTIKGDVKSKRPQSHEELISTLSEASAESVRYVYEMWKSNDGKQTLTLTYDNKRYNKKKLKKDAYAELSIGFALTPER